MRQPIAIFAAFVRRDWATALSYRLPFGLEIANSLFNLALFFYLSRLIGGSLSRSHQDLTRGYFAFVVIGVTFVGIGEAGLTSFGQRLRQEQTAGTLEALLATAAPQWLVILGSAGYDLLRATVTALITIGLAIVLFGLRLETNFFTLPVVVAALIGSLALFAALGVLVAAFTVVFKQTTAILGMVIGGLALLSGVYFPTSVLPGPLKLLAEASPFTWGLDVFRAVLLRGEVDTRHLLILIPSGVMAMPLALLVFRMSLNRARRAGTLAQY